MSVEESLRILSLNLVHRKRSFTDILTISAR
jgi:hypothetical protein